MSTPPTAESSAAAAGGQTAATAPSTGAGGPATGGNGVPGVPGVPGGSGRFGSSATGTADGGLRQRRRPPVPRRSPRAPGQFTPGQFIGVVFAVPAADAQAQQRAEVRRQQLVQAGIAASILRTSEFPNLRFGQSTQPPVDSFLVYVGPFENSPSLSQFCQAQPALLAPCLPVRPSP